tara:strand:- start:223 stop:936 length:714 start_codon:yes stop_codon:yes gene_type:complete
LHFAISWIIVIAFRNHLDAPTGRMHEALMKRNDKSRSIGLGAGVLVFFSMIYWYSWSTYPLTQDEIDAYLDTIAAQDHVVGREHDLRSLRQFLEEDDGQPFYTVNLYKFFEQADYDSDAPFGGTGREAFDRFSSVMIRLLAERASHPIFGSDWVFNDGTDWDRLVIVRYRSRRDIVDIFASEAFEAASVHKWAGLRENGRMLVQGLHIPAAYLPVAILALFTAILVTLITRALTRRS